MTASFGCSTLTGGHHSASTNGNGNAGNNYSRPEGQNVGNFLTDKNTSRVLAPPGGKSSFSFGGDDNVSPAKSAQANLHDPNVVHKELTLANWLTETDTVCKKKRSFKRPTMKLSDSAPISNFLSPATATSGSNLKSSVWQQQVLGQMKSLPEQQSLWAVNTARSLLVCVVT